jgi:catalase
MTVEQKQAFFTNTAAAMAGVPEEIQRHWIGHCTKADRDYGWGIARALGLKPPLAAE